MDETDIRLVELLQKDSRVTVSQLSKELSLSRPSISERILRLQERGVIEEFTARISLPAIGRDVIMFIQLGSLKLPIKQVEDTLSQDADILECHRVTGPFDYVIKAAVSGMNGMRSIIDRLMPLGDINTAVVLSSPVANRHVKHTGKKPFGEQTST